MNNRDIIDSIRRSDAEARNAARKLARATTTSKVEAERRYNMLVNSWPDWRELARGYLKSRGVKLSESDESYINNQ